MGEILGALLLPLFMLVVLFSIAGVKPDVIGKLVGDIIVAFIKGVAMLVAAVVRGLTEAGIIALMARRLSGPSYVQSKPAPGPRRVKVTVLDEGDE